VCKVCKDTDVTQLVPVLRVWTLLQQQRSYCQLPLLAPRVTCLDVELLA